jgi:hypothetical protein
VGGGNLVWVFADQNFPPCLPSDGSGPCPKIIRNENGNLLSMISSFLVKYGQAVKNNDIVLIASATQLQKEGLCGYIESYLEAITRLRLGQRAGLIVLPAPFIFLGGCNDQALIRAVVDFHAWVKMSDHDPDGLLNDSIRVVERHLKGNPDIQQEKMAPPSDTKYHLGPTAA